jgi:hypothetical protein
VGGTAKAIGSPQKVQAVASVAPVPAAQVISVVVVAVARGERWIPAVAVRSKIRG